MGGWQNVGGRLANERMALRIYLTGKLCLEAGTTLVDEASLPGRQGRVLLALLAAEPARAVPFEEAAGVLWPDGPPRSWETALRALVSKLRAAVAPAGLGVESAFGCYQLTVPAGTWVDVLAAADAIHRAETGLRDGDLDEAIGWALVATSIATRPFLAGEDGDWVSRQREGLAQIRLRALDCRAQLLLAAGDPDGGRRDAEQAVGLDPFRESSHRHLMRCAAAAGDRAGALRAYERLRTVLGEQLGADPAPETEAVYLEILSST